MKEYTIVRVTQSRSCRDTGIVDIKESPYCKVVGLDEAKDTVLMLNGETERGPYGAEVWYEIDMGC